MCPDPKDGPSTHFPNPRVRRTINRPTLEEKYLLPTGYKFIIPDPDAIVNRPPPRWITVYRVAFSYSLRFRLHKVIVKILNKYELVPA